jgi:hypothetical protein
MTPSWDQHRLAVLERLDRLESALTALSAQVTAIDRKLTFRRGQLTALSILLSILVGLSAIIGTAAALGAIGTPHLSPAPVQESPAHGVQRR